MLTEATSRLIFNYSSPPTWYPLLPRPQPSRSPAFSQRPRCRCLEQLLESLRHSAGWGAGQAAAAQALPHRAQAPGSTMFDLVGLGGSSCRSTWGCLRGWGMCGFRRARARPPGRGAISASWSSTPGRSDAVRPFRAARRSGLFVRSSATRRPGCRCVDFEISIRNSLT